MTVHPSVAFAAFAAGLVVGGGAYAASHDLGLGDGLTASAGARARLGQQIPAGRHGRRTGLLEWHAPHVPHLRAGPSHALRPGLSGAGGLSGARSRSGLEHEPGSAGDQHEPDRRRRWRRR